MHVDRYGEYWHLSIQLVLRHARCVALLPCTQSEGVVGEDELHWWIGEVYDYNSD